MSRSEILSLPKRPELEHALPAYLQHDLDALTRAAANCSEVRDEQNKELNYAVHGME